MTRAGPGLGTVHITVDKASKETPPAALPKQEMLVPLELQHRNKSREGELHQPRIFCPEPGRSRCPTHPAATAPVAYCDPAKLPAEKMVLGELGYSQDEITEDCQTVLKGPLLCSGLWEGGDHGYWRKQRSC